MKTYDYMDHEVEDIKDYIKRNQHMYEDSDFGDDQTLYDIAKENRDTLIDDLFIADDVTGNFSGSYTFSRYEAEQNLADNYALIIQALDYFDCDYNKIFHDGPEKIDVTIRCYLLDEALDVAIDDLKESTEQNN